MKVILQFGQRGIWKALESSRVGPPRKQGKFMSDCCAIGSSETAVQTCPECGAVCKSIEMRTLYHQVKFPENQHIASGNYYFCPSGQCSTGYFSNVGCRIPKSHLRACQEIRRGKLCYCFDIDTGLYLSALRVNRADSIKGFVMQRTKAGECACEFRNPSGRCCLAEFKRLEKESGKTAG